MNKAFEECKRLVANNALHRKGHRLADVTPGFHAAYVLNEVVELIDAESCDGSIRELTGMSPVSGLAQTPRAHCLEELADACNCLDIYAVSKGFTEEEIEAEQLRKLALRFTTEDKK